MKKDKAKNRGDKNISVKAATMAKAEAAAPDEPKEDKKHEPDALEAAQAEISELRDKLLRQLAETENVRKRSRREIEDAGKFAIERFAAGILDVVDNLERALKSEHDNADALREGVQLTLNAWHDTMRKFHIERVDAPGQDFNPHLHEALAQVPDEAPAGKVIAQHAAGYTLHGRLLRPARVIVSAGPAKEKDDTGANEQGTGAGG